MKILVGHTGFVGSNLNAQTTFDKVFNSKNIESAFGLRPDLLVYCGVRAEKFIANQQPEKDLEHIKTAMIQIDKIKPKKIVLISTIDVYPNPINTDESTLLSVDDKAASPYGRHRLMLENHVASHYTDYHIVRLPGLFGKGIKKNFIFDLLNPIPQKLTRVLYDKFVIEEVSLKTYYTLNEATGFYELLEGLDFTKDSPELIAIFKRLHFSTLSFTDSRGIFQFYPLMRLWSDIKTVILNNLKYVNLATEPVSISDLYHALYQKSFENPLSKPIPSYDFKTQHALAFGGHNGYLMSSNEVILAIKTFIETYKKE